MNKETVVKTLLVWLMLAALMTSAFLIRWRNAKDSFAIVTIDEMVYFRMAQQILIKPSAYHTIPYGRELAAKNPDLPLYFKKPLFKHPPIFTYLLALVFKLAKPAWEYAFILPILFSVGMLPLIYFLGRRIYDETVGLLAVLFLWMDPVSIMSSQKLWMDTTIAFFTLLSAVFFVHAITKKKDWGFIASGIAAGFAVNTKYTGILIVAAFAAYAALYEKDLFKNRKFRISLALPFLMLVPWIAWNISVYGPAFFSEFLAVNAGTEKFLKNLGRLFPFLGFCLAAWFLFKNKKMFAPLQKRLPRLKISVPFPRISTTQRICPASPSDGPSWIQNASGIFCLVFLVGFTGDYIARGLNFFSVPVTSWEKGYFSSEPAYFYIGRLMEFCPLYLFTFISLFTFRPTHDLPPAVIRLSGALILIFFMGWGGYQSRYILSAIPFFILLSSALITKIYTQPLSLPPKTTKAVKICFLFFLFYATLKTLHVNTMVGFPNDFCYF